MPLDLTSFAIKWQQTQLTERSAYQQHFRDLCEALNVPHPTEEDLVGNNYTFEKHVTKTGDGKGFADVWKRDAFAFEYKLPGGNLCTYCLCFLATLHSRHPARSVGSWIQRSDA